MLIRAAILLSLALSTGWAGTLCTALADSATGRILRQDGACGQRVTPQSTFKIAISLMGFDSGFLVDEHSPALPFHKGYPDWIPEWRATTDPLSWIKNSVVWFSQQVTKSLGEERFRRYVTEFHYGNEDVSGDPGKHNGLTEAWLSSSLKISPLEQLAFLEKVSKRQFPIAARAYDMTARITAVTTLPNGWEIHGKTGSGPAIAADGSVEHDRDFGWYVGWASKNGRTLVFARLIQDDKPESVRAGLRARDSILAELPALLDSY